MTPSRYVFVSIFYTIQVTFEVKIQTGRYMFPGILDLSAAVIHRSLFLLGPRQTGKSTFLRERFPTANHINLLEHKTYLWFAEDPDRLMDVVERYIQQQERNSLVVVVIDEIQKIPQLLDSVHRLIEKHKTCRFIMTGSSARKLRKSGVNLLGGRAHQYFFHPLCSQEASGQPSAAVTWKELLCRGGLPAYATSADIEKDLQTYSELYLKEEIQQEALVRNLPAFSRFLHTAIGANAQQIIFEKLAARAGISSKSCHSYFSILEDTLVGTLLPSFKDVTKRQPVAAPKFYFFDVGVVRFMQGRLDSDSLLDGNDFETFILNELRCWNDYCQKGLATLSYWRTKGQAEVDFIVQRGKYTLALEAKTSRRLTEHDFSGLKAFGEEELKMHRVLVCPWAVDHVRKDGIHVLSVETFLKELWSGKLIDS